MQLLFCTNRQFYIVQKSQHSIIIRYGNSNGKLVESFVELYDAKSSLNAEILLNLITIRMPGKVIEHYFHSGDWADKFRQKEKKWLDFITSLETFKIAVIFEKFSTDIRVQLKDKLFQVIYRVPNTEKRIAAYL